jgi:RTX calcium-binding nonapeptide repeat (4 copies)
LLCAFREECAISVTLDLNATDLGTVNDTSSYTENQAASLVLFGDVNVSSPGGDVVAYIELAIANYNGTETLSIPAVDLPASLSASWNAALGILTISANDTSPMDGIWANALNSVRYQDALNDAPAHTRTITVTASNGVDSFATATETINITRVNDFPTANITLTDYNATEGTTLNLKGTGIVVNDLDSGNSNVSLEISVTEGVIFANANGIVGINVINGTGTGTVNILGTLTAIKALLAASGTNVLSYVNNSDTPSAGVTLKVVLRDNGNTGDAPTPSIPAEDTATIHIAQVNDVTVALTNTRDNIDENTSTATHIKVADIVVTDPDGGTNTLGLTGADIDFFEIVGTGLYVKADTIINFEWQESYQIAVTADDASTAGAPDATSTFYTLNVNNISPENVIGTTAGETLVGDADIDLIRGLAGNDVLFGFGGNDTLTGGLGVDQLTGNEGSDTFKFEKKAEAQKGLVHDSIADFSGFGFDGDLIDLQTMDANTHKHGNQNFKSIGSKHFHHKAGELHYVSHGTYVTVEGDINGNGKADFQIDVHNVSDSLGSLLKADFVL